MGRYGAVVRRIKSIQQLHNNNKKIKIINSSILYMFFTKSLRPSNPLPFLGLFIFAAWQRDVADALSPEVNRNPPLLLSSIRLIHTPQVLCSSSSQQYRGSSRVWIRWSREWETSFGWGGRSEVDHSERSILVIPLTILACLNRIILKEYGVVQVLIYRLMKKLPLNS